MSKYIFGSKHGIHVIDLKKTQVCIDVACDALQEIVKSGEKVLFVGTKKQAKDIIRSEASRINMPYVCERWLGGMLTNFSTIRKSLKNLQTLERYATDGTYEKISKKERLTIEKDLAKLDKALGGIRDLKKLPGAVFIADIKKEHIAVAEARKLSVPIVAMVDTNVDPDLVDYPIPGNDDAFKSVGLITRALAEAIEEAAAVAAERRVADQVATTGIEEQKTAQQIPSRRRRPKRRQPSEREAGGPVAGEKKSPEDPAVLAKSEKPTGDGPAASEPEVKSSPSEKETPKKAEAEEKPAVTKAVAKKPSGKPEEDATKETSEDSQS
jgi:small subunit ribosomal protein S2